MQLISTATPSSLENLWFRIDEQILWPVSPSVLALELLLSFY